RIFARGRRDRPGPGAPFALRVDVRHGGNSQYATLTGQTQAKAAALGAAGVARALATGDVQWPGAWMPDQVIAPAPFLAWLAPHALKVELCDLPSRAYRSERPMTSINSVIFWR